MKKKVVTLLDQFVKFCQEFPPFWGQTKSQLRENSTYFKQSPIRASHVQKLTHFLKE